MYYLATLQEAKAYWDVPVFADREHLNRVDPRFSNYKKEKVIVIEMSCLRMDNRT